MAVRRKLTAIRLDKIAAVDKPCQQHATVAIIKRAPAGPVPPAIAKKTFTEALHTQLVSDKISETFWRAFENQWAVRDAFRTALTDEIAEGGDGTTATADFTAAMQQIATLAAEHARNAAGTEDTDLEQAVEDAINKWLESQETPMSKFTTKAALQAAISTFAIAKATAQDVADIKDSAVTLNETGLLPAEGVLAIAAAPAADPAVASLKREVAVLKMAPAVRTHFDGLDQAGQDAFIAKSAEDQQKVIDDIAKGDPVVHKCLDGTEIRKSDGAAVLALAKRNDQLATDLAKATGEGATDRIEKRAVEQFPHVAKATAVDMLKSAAQVGEESDAGKAVLKTLDTMNKAQSGLFKSLGGLDGEVTADVSKGMSDFNAKVAEIKKRDSIGGAEAMSKARVEFPDLAKAALPRNRDRERLSALGPAQLEASRSKSHGRYPSHRFADRLQDRHRRHDGQGGPVRQARGGRSRPDHRSGSGRRGRHHRGQGHRAAHLDRHRQPVEGPRGRGHRDRRRHFVGCQRQGPCRRGR